MNTRSQSVGSHNHSEAGAIELEYTTRNSDEISLIHKDDHADPPRAHQRNVPWLSAWLFEIASLSVAFAVFAAVVVILLWYHRQPNPSWSSWITLNTIVSVASMVFRVCLMVPTASCISQLNWTWFSQGRRPLCDIVRFDQASRSPYGSLQLLFSHHIRTFAFIGAIVSNFNLLSGPFFQQSLEFKNIYVNVTSADAVAYASFAATYKPTYGFLDIAGNHVSPNMKAAVYSGLLASGAVSVPTPPFFCPSGECRWDPFHTLAVDVQCRDAPEMFNLTCNGSNNSKPCILNATDHPRRFTRFHKEGEDIAFPQTVFYFAEATVLANKSSSYELDQPWNISTGNRADIDWIRTRNPSEDGYVLPNSTIESRQCKIYTCIQEISAKVVNGTYAENVTKTTIEATEYNTTSGRTAYAYMYSLPNGTISNLTVEQNKQQTLIDTISAPFEAMRLPDHDPSGWISTAQVKKNGTGLDGTDILKTLYETRNLTKMVHNLVLHMNVALRSMHTFEDLQKSDRDNEGRVILPKNYLSTEERTDGIARLKKIHVYARCEWLILPGLLMALCFALLLATIEQTRGQKIGVWKENPLALLLFSKFDDQCKPAPNCACTEEDIRRAAEGLDAQLTVGAETGSRDVRDRILIRRKVEI